MKKKFTVAAAMLLAATAAVSGSAQAQSQSQPAYTPGGLSPAPSGGAFTMGFSFSAAAGTFVNALGAYDNDSDGFAAPMSVGLWDNAGNLLLQTTVSSTDMLIQSFRYATVNSYELTAGTTYVVGAFRYAGSGETYATGFNGGTTAPGITTIAARYNDSGRFAFPDMSVNTNGYFGANLLVGDRVVAAPVDAVPEPASWAMMLAGFAMLGASLRVRRARIALA